MVVFPSPKLPPFHGGNTGSNPVRDATSQIKAYIQKRCPLTFWLGGIFAICGTFVAQKSAYILKFSGTFVQKSLGRCLFFFFGLAIDSKCHYI